jgi:hypothetical protein
MLSQKQRDLFKLLGIPLEQEKQARANHKDSLAMIYFTRKNPTPKSFTTYLEQRLKAKWRAEIERGKPIYLGD